MCWVRRNPARDTIGNMPRRLGKRGGNHQRPPMRPTQRVKQKRQWGEVWHVREGAGLADGGGARGRVGLGHGEAKVGELGDERDGEEDVLGLDVAVD